MTYDYIIKNAKIIDGSNTPWFMGDVAIKGDRIAAVGKLTGCAGADCACGASKFGGAGAEMAAAEAMQTEEKAMQTEADAAQTEADAAWAGAAQVQAKRVIDAAGRILAPGFIDTHTHLDLVPFPFYPAQDPTSVRRLQQGITSQIVGCCGISPAPVMEDSKAEWLERTFGVYEPEATCWTGFDGFLKAMEERPLGVNHGAYVGHGAIRYCVMGYENRPATPREIAKMQKLLEQAMKGGAVGMSTGLIYAPGVFAETQELVELCAVLKDYNGIYASHIRSENQRWLSSVEEVIEICEKNRIPGIVHHLKTKARDSEALVRKVLDTIDKARARGVDVVFEQYPYEASATGLDVVLSSYMLEGGKEAIRRRLLDKENFEKYRQSIRSDYGWKNDEEEWEGAKNMLILSAKDHPEYIGLTIDQIAEQKGMEPVETVFRVLLETELSAGAAFFGIKERDISTILQSPYGMIGSDSDACKIGETSHPRTNGTFPRVLKRYALDQGVISLENAIYKMTGFPAARFGLAQRGLVRQGFYADLVLFNPEVLEDRPTYLDPFAQPTGFDMVFVNGKPALEGGKATGALCGRVLRPGK